MLSHELLHLWVPNSLPLEGDYDWFFEGFTLYQALRTSVKLGFVRFSDYLETLARVYDSYRAVADRDRLSLIEASKQRWTTSSSLVYDKGMLVAFICDLILRSNSYDKTSLNDVYRKLFQSDFAASRDANDLIISILKMTGALNPFLQQYVLSAGTIDLGSLLKSFGIKLQFVDSHARLEVSSSIDKPQLRVLRSVGYKP